MATVTLKNIKKSYGKVMPVKGISLDIKDGELITLLGASGCGKTTTLRIVAGLIEQDEGDVIIDGVSMAGVQPWKRDIGFVFQSYALFPHLTAFKNIAYGLQQRKWKHADIEPQVKKVSEMAEIGSFLHRYPHQLSGGQQQRVALARALVMNPKVLLMDEPLSGLDAKLRERMQYELKAVQKSFNITTIYVTHDQQETFALADRVVIMNEGRIAQVGSPTVIYTSPKTNFVAKFIGASNSSEGIVTRVDEKNEQVQIECKGVSMIAQLNEAVNVGDKIDVVIRSNRILLGKDSKKDENCIKVYVVGITLSGSFWKVDFNNGELHMRADINDATVDKQFYEWKKDDVLYAYINKNNIWYYKKGGAKK